MSLLADKVVLVSGGTQGVGAAIARAAVDEGATVAVSGRREASGRPSPPSSRNAAAAAAAYVAGGRRRRRAGAGQSSRRSCERFGRIDCLVNAAGTTSRGTLLDTTPELFDAARRRQPAGAVLPDAGGRAGHAAGGRHPGTIVNVITMSAHGGQPYLAPYVATKAGLVGLTRNAAHAHRWDRIRVNGVNIGWTETEGEDAVQREFHGAEDGWLERAAADLPMGKLGQPDDAAALVVLLLSDRSGVVTGSVIDWDQDVPGAHD